MTVPPYKEYLLGQLGADYVEHVLSFGREFSRSVAACSTVKAESVTTFLPMDAELAAVHSLEVGGIAPGEPPLDWLADRIRSHLATAPSCAVVFEDLLWKPSDPSLARSQSRVVIYGDTVLHVLVSGDVSDFAIRTTVAEAASPAMTTGFFTHLPAGLMLDGLRTNIEVDDFQRLVDAVSSVVVLAYDGEGFILADLHRSAAHESALHERGNERGK